ARDVDVVDVCGGRDLAGEHDQAGVAKGLGGDARESVLRQDGVQDPVRDLVGDLVRMPFGDRFGGEQEFVGQLFSPVEAVAWPPAIVLAAPDAGGDGIISRSWSRERDL